MMRDYEYTLNLGPQHPAAHGLLRLLLQLDGEVIKNVEPHVGFLHRGVEKLVEQKNYGQIVPYVDRLDYLAALANEHAFVLAIEKLLHLNVPVRAQYIRVMLDEVTRILSHLLWLGTHALDIGMMSMFLYCMREREALLACYHAVSGSRMHTNYYCPGGLRRDLPESMPNGKSFLDYLQEFANDFPVKIDEYESMLTKNLIWKKRTVGVGVINKQQALSCGFTGPMLRATGVTWDLRKNQPYSVYSELKFDVATADAGDCYARYLVRMREMRESVKLILQCIEWLRQHDGAICSENVASAMQLRLEGEIYACVEHPKGEFGVYLIGDGSNKPYRVKFRGASFPHLAALNELAKEHMLADLVAIISSADIIVSEVDR